jgi:hypothetical protein
MTPREELPELPEPAIISDDMLDGYLDPDAEYTAEQMRAYGQQCWQAATQRERERCAQIAENTEAGDGSHDYNAGAENMSENIAAAIRKESKGEDQHE